MQERKSRNKSSRFSVLVALGLLLLLAFVSSSVVSGATRPASAATAPAVQITPNSGPYHTVTVVTGKGLRHTSKWRFTNRLGHSSPTKRTRRGVLWVLRIR